MELAADLQDRLNNQAPRPSHGSRVTNPDSHFFPTGYALVCSTAGEIVELGAEAAFSPGCGMVIRESSAGIFEKGGR